MPETKTCPKCGAGLPDNAPSGICPKCLMQAALESDADAGSTPEMKPTTLTSGFVPPAPEELAKHFPQLEILELLGKGGMGAVYKARQPGLDRLVAVKILPPEIGADPAFAERFTREARALAKLSHQNIVSVFDFGQADGQFYFVMEFVDGTNLRQLIETGGLKPEEALAIVPQICEALQFAHNAGIVHRDIKPENILVDKQGRVKIADFGLAKLLGKARAEFTLTGAHQVMGTLHYMAPEQMRGAGSVDHRADIYSLGVVFYEMLTGQLPIGKFEPPSKKVHVDVRLDEVVLRSLENEPARRYQHASDVKTAVEVISGSAVSEFATVSSGREDTEKITGWAIVRQSFLVLLSIAGTLTLFMPWTLVKFGQTFPDGGGIFVQLAVHGVYHWFPVFGALLSAALMFVTLLSIGRSRRPLRAILSIAAGLALTSLSLFTIAAKPLTVHPESYIDMVTTMDAWSGHGKTGASALAELVRLSQTTDRWTPGKRHVTIYAEPFVGSWVALGTGLLLLVLGTFEFTSVVGSSLNHMVAAPLQTAAAPAQALRLTGMLGPSAFLIVLLMNMADVFINGGGAPGQPWSLLRTLLIWAFAVHLFHACFITPWILFGANRLQTLSSPGAVRAASILAMLPLSFSAFVGIPSGLWSLFVLRRHSRSSVDAELKHSAGEKTGTSSVSLPHTPAESPAVISAPCSAAVASRPRGTLGRAWDAWWAERDRWFTNGVQSVLVAFSILCLMGYLSFHTSSNLLPETNRQRLRHTVVEYGVPDSWFHFEMNPDERTAFTWKIDWFSSSTGLMLLGFVAWCVYCQIAKAKAMATGKKLHWADSPQAMVSAWAVLTVFAVVWGFHPLYLDFAKSSSSRAADDAGSAADSTLPKTGEQWSGNEGQELVMFWGSNSPTVSDRLASHLGLNPAQREAMNQAFQMFFREFKALEEQNTRHETDENGHQITTIAPLQQQLAPLAERFWSELDSVLDGRQLTLGRKTVGLGMGMFESVYNYRIEIWRVGQVNPWFHWKESYPGRANVTPSSDIEPSSGPELPEKLCRFWKEPVTDAPQNPSRAQPKPDRSE